MFEDVLILKKGGIHIKKKNRGSFTRWCKGKVTEECIRRGKNSSNPAIRKKSIFAANARHWKHENGGVIRFQPGGTVKLDDYGYPADITPAVVTQDPEFNKFLMTLPDNLRLTPEKEYYLYKSWNMNGRPRNFQEGLEANMYNWDDSDNSYHGVTVIGYDENGVGIFGKPKHHDTVHYELDWYNKGIGTLEGGKQYPLQGEERKEWEDFKSQYQLDSTGVDYRYVPIKKNGGILKYQNPAIPLDLPEGSEYGGELEPVIIKPAPIKAELNTYYPIVSKYPWTGHSELILHNAGPQKSSIIITRGGYNSDYNLITNNCSDSTRCAMEQIYNEKINPILFTTPGDVRDFLLKKGVDKIKTGKGVESQYFEIPFATAMELRNKNIDYQIQDYLKKAEDHKKDMEKLAKSHDRKWNSSGYDESTAKVIEELERRKYKFQPFKNNNGGILKAQEGTGNLLTPHPLSPIGLALNQAKAVAKMKGDQQHLPSGVKEVVGPDGKKIAIRTEQPLVPLEQNIAEWLPGTGDVAEVGYIANDVKNGNLGSAALAAGLMFLPGNVNKLISKSRIDPIFINGKINQAGIQEGLFGGKRSAESFMGSQTYKDAVAHDIALAKRAFGYDINPVVDNRYIKMPVKVEGASLGPHDAGIMYSNPNTNNPADDRILVDVGKHKTVNDLAATIFHENLHHGRFKTIDPQGNTIFTEIYHPEKVNPTLDFYRWKLKHLFKPEVEIPQELLDHYKYLTSVEIPHNEGATNVLELGFLGNARAKNGYPGAQEVQRILDEVRKVNPQHAYTIDLLNMKKPKRVWEAMTGQYEDGGKLTDDDYRERVKKFLLWKTVSPEESTYIKNFKM